MKPAQRVRIIGVRHSTNFSTADAQLRGSLAAVVVRAGQDLAIKLVVDSQMPTWQLRRDAGNQISCAGGDCGFIAAINVDRDVEARVLVAELDAGLDAAVIRRVRAERK